MRSTLDFLLYDWLEVDGLLTRERFEDHSRETFDAIFETSERIARDCFLPANRLIDTQEPEFANGAVKMPPETAAAVRTYAESGLLAAGHDFEIGGMQLPYVIDMAANMFFSKASIGLAAYAMLTYANGNLLLAYGTPAQRRAFAQPTLTGRALGTMCLSEPQAGSSLGDIATRATPDGRDFADDPLGPRYRIFGNKMWISGGDHELSENIVHLVLAKIPDAEGNLPSGTGGISLFVSPRRIVDTQGDLTGQRNDIALAGLNHKLGYRGIVNTLLNFGEGQYAVPSKPGQTPAPGALGYLIGEPGRGLQYMFHMMNEARINVGMGAAMLGYAGYEASLEYARTRLQGRRHSSGRKNAAAAQVPILDHHDVKRMVLAQKAYSEGAIALCLYCARLVDERNTGEDESAAEADLLLGILTPIAKSWPSEWCQEANSLAIQVHGGYGYTRDFPVEQYWRDNRLNMIHEGTHGIQAVDLLNRKVRVNEGAALEVLGQRIAATSAAARDFPELDEFAAAIDDAFVRVRAATQDAWSEGDGGEPLANATPYMQAFGHMCLAWIWLEVATAALRTMQESEVDSDSHRGRVQAARFFFRHELPKIEPWLGIVARRDRTVVDMQNSWF